MSAPQIVYIVHLIHLKYEFRNCLFNVKKAGNMLVAMNNKTATLTCLIFHLRRCHQLTQ